MPREGNGKWKPSTAEISGFITGPPSIPLNVSVFLKPSDKSFESSVIYPFQNFNEDLKFSFLVGTCNSTKYQIRVNSFLPICNIGSDEMDVFNGEVYSVDFDIKNNFFVSCSAADFKTYSYDNDGDYFADRYKLTVTDSPKKGQMDSNHTDCDDSSSAINPNVNEICDDQKDNNCNGKVDEFCSGFKLLNALETPYGVVIDSHTGYPVFDCPTLDSEGNIYYFYDQNTLLSYDTELNKRWELKVNFIGKILAGSNTIYIASDTSNEGAIAVSKTGVFNWQLKKGQYYGTSFIDGDDLYSLHGDGLDVIYGPGNIKNVINSMGGTPAIFGKNVNYAVTYSGYVEAYDKSWVKLWSTADPQKEFYDSEHGSVIIGNDDSVFFGSGVVPKINSLSKDGIINWQHNEGSWGLKQTQPMIVDEYGNVYITGANTIDSLSSTGDLRWKSDTFDTLFMPRSLTALQGGHLFFVKWEDIATVIDSANSDVEAVISPSKENFKFKSCPFMGTPDGRAFILERKYGDPDVYRILVYQTPYAISNSPWPMINHDLQKTKNAATPIK